MDNATRLERLFSCCQLFQTLAPTFRVSQVMALADLYLNPGETQNELAEHLGFTVSGVSRLVDVLSDSGRRDRDTQGLDLITASYVDDDHRIRTLELTQRGERLLEVACSILYH